MIDGSVNIQLLPLDVIDRSPYQSRVNFDDTALAELADSVKLHGIIQPIIVRLVQNGRYELIAGERRWRAAQLAQLDTIPTIIRDIPDEQACQLNTVENINRVDLDPIEEGHAYKRLIDDFGYTHEEVGQVVGKSRAKITNLLRLLTLAPEIIAAIATRDLSESQGKLLVGLPIQQQIHLFRQCIVKGWSQRQLSAAINAIRTTKKHPSASEDSDMRILERELAEHLGCQCHIDFRHGSGVLRIDFHDIDVLQGLLQKIGYTYNAS